MDPGFDYVTPTTCFTWSRFFNLSPCEKNSPLRPMHGVSLRRPRDSPTFQAEIIISDSSQRYDTVGFLRSIRGASDGDSLIVSRVSNRTAIQRGDIPGG